jgi:hypothetical protein
MLFIVLGTALNVLQFLGRQYLEHAPIVEDPYTFKRMAHQNLQDVFYIHNTILRERNDRQYVQDAAMRRSFFQEVLGCTEILTPLNVVIVEVIL